MPFPFAIRIALGFIAVATTLPATTQTPEPATPPPDTLTLHVFVNRMQIPVLLLDSYRHPAKPVPQDRFTIRLDDMPPTQPTRVRREGDDPIALAVLVDRSKADEDLWDRLPAAATALMARLNPNDHVEVYGIDGCKMRRFGQEETARDGHLQEDLASAALNPTFHRSSKLPDACPQPINLWDAMLYITSQLETRDGRRVLLALTDGQHDGSDDQMNRLRRLLNHDAVSLFAVKHGEGNVVAMPNDHIPRSDKGKAVGGAAAIVWDGESLALQSELSGGMTVTASIHSLAATLQTVLGYVRERYILEFPRPAEMTRGEHTVSVSIGKGNAFIRPAGMSLPVATADEVAASAAKAHENETAAEAAESAPPEPQPEAPVVTPAAILSSPAQAAPVAAVPRAAPADPLDITDEVQGNASTHRP